MFVHPLVRSAKVFAAQSLDGKEHQVLVIVTTLALDPASSRYKAGLVEKLTAAARNYVEVSDHVTAFVLMNRVNDWEQGHANRPRHHWDASTIHL